MSSPAEARYGGQLEKRPFETRTVDFLRMMLFGALSLLALSTIPPLWSPFLGVSLVFMLLYVWSREFRNAQISIYGLVTLKAFYLPWAMLAVDVIFGSPLTPDLLGIIAGHLYYFLTFVASPCWWKKYSEDSNLGAVACCTVGGWELRQMPQFSPTGVQVWLSEGGAIG